VAEYGQLIFLSLCSKQLTTLGSVY